MIVRDKAWRIERGGYFTDEIRKASESDRSDLLKRIKQYREYYYMEPGGFDVEGEDGTESDLHIPLIMQKVETATPKIVSSVWRANPFVRVRRPGGSDFSASSAKNVEIFLSWAFHNDIPDFYMVFESFIRNMCIDGTAFAKIRWQRKTRQGIENFLLDGYEGEYDADSDSEVPRPRPIEDIFEEVFGLGDVEQTYVDHKQLEPSKFEVEFTDGGRRQTAIVDIFNSDHIRKIKVRVKRNIVTHESPVIELVELEDLLFPYKSSTLQAAPWVAHKTWYSYKEIQDLVDAGEWQLTKDELATLFNNARVTDNSDLPSITDPIKDEATGVSSTQDQARRSADNRIDTNRILVWEVYVEDYVDGDKEKPISVIHYIPEIVQKIASTEYADELLPHGQRPFACATYLPVSGRVYGIGMAELLYGVNQSIDKTINNVHDNLEITTHPAFFYSPLAMARGGKGALRLKSGEGIPVMNPRDVYFPNFAQQPLEMYHATFNQMMGVADQLTFSPSLTGSNNYRNAPRTARGTLALMEAAEEKLSTIVEQLQANAWKDMVKQVAALYGANLTIDKWYYVTGQAEAKHISPKELRDNFVFEFSGSLTSVNRDVQRTNLQQLYLTLREEPEYQQDPHAKNNLRRYYASALGDNIDVESILPAPPGTAGMPHPKWDQQRELQYMSTGEYVEVLDVDDHMQHITVIDQFMKTEVWETIPEHSRGMISAHLASHKSKLQQSMQHNQRVADTQGSAAAMANTPGAGALDLPAEPGAPQEGIPAPGGETSFLGGVT